MAARYADQFYGLLALERLGQPPNLPMTCAPYRRRKNAPAQRRPLTQAVREVARSGMAHDRPLLQGNRRAAADRRPAHAGGRTGARTCRRDLGVIVGQAAGHAASSISSTSPSCC
jgi:soluble lytic murein transglycosylase